MLQFRRNDVQLEGFALFPCSPQTLSHITSAGQYRICALAKHPPLEGLFPHPLNALLLILNKETVLKNGKVITLEEGVRANIKSYNKSIRKKLLKPNPS